MKKEKNCFIIGAGEFYGFASDKHPKSGGLIIAADGGFLWLEKAGIKPDIVIGDFDSFTSSEIKIPDSTEIIRLPKEKNDTDMLAAIKTGMNKGCNVFHIYGGTGGRQEHTLANIQCLAYIVNRGAKGYIYGGGFIMTLLRNGAITFDSSYSGYISVFAYSETARGVSEKGLKYGLNNVTLTNDTPVGVSNEFIGEAAKISVEQGSLIIVIQRFHL